ncbi:hypothetical protein CYY_000934 [Polysphondylium violaceum]|uniref:Uncharacterized protein n=1 Tax=Polysphondylium violaceum TaxID=133409 RepID=A0A8J4V8E7_9MYCE|nr:hypothetical protein CYY_000934 [Polysphondylium violaceum]
MDNSLFFTNNSPSCTIPNKIDKYEYIRLDKPKPGSFVAELVLNRPKKLNSMTDDFFNEFNKVWDEIQSDESIRVVVVWGEGRMFTAGLDLVSIGPLIQGDSEKSQAVQNVELFKMVRRWQSAFDKINKCSKPVIAAIHGYCIGGGVDLACACDIRLCTKDAKFSIKETKLAIVADLGTLQRVAKICGTGFAREMAFTGEDIDSENAKRCRLVNHVYADQATLMKEARDMAERISKNSALVAQSTKLILNHADDHKIDEGLLRVALHNTAFLKSDDLNEAAASFMEKRAAIFHNNL